MGTGEVSQAPAAKGVLAGMILAMNSKDRKRRYDCIPVSYSVLSDYFLVLVGFIESYMTTVLPRRRPKVSRTATAS